MNAKSLMLKKALYIIVPLAMIAFVAIKLKSNKEISQRKIYQYDKEQAIPVEVDTLQLENSIGDFSYSGTFEPNKETKISAEIQGKINTMMVDVGGIVHKNQALIQLDNTLLKLQLQTMDVQIEGLEADVNRYAVLAKADAIQGVQLEKTELGLKSAKIQKSTLQEQINKTTIKAPFNGIVTAKLSEEGAFAAPGVPLLQITDISILKFTINVSENELKRFKINQNHLITADVFPEIALKGKLTMIGSKSNMGSSFPVQFTVKNTSDLNIKSGMFGKVLSNNGSTEVSIVIPASAILGTANQPQVYIIKNGKSILQNITIEKRIQNKVVISSGLNAGDIIVTNGFVNLFDGANVSFK